MSLQELVNNSLTDKNTTHSYMALYEHLLSEKMVTATHILEVGIGDFNEKNGGSLKLWHDYFPNATIYGLDILDDTRVIDELKNNPRVVLHTSTDAYTEETAARFAGLKFDMMLDDGPHTLESMKQFIRLYSNYLKEDGVLIVEDVQRLEWTDELRKVVPEDLQKYIQIFDLRHIKGRYDDIVFVLTSRLYFNETLVSLK
jgi:hypothetical protein